MRDAADEGILAAAGEMAMTLVTYDTKTIPPLLLAWAYAERPHAGVILIDDRTIRPEEVGSLVTALLDVLDTTGSEDWTNRTVYLP